VNITGQTLSEVLSSIITSTAQEVVIISVSILNSERLNHTGVTPYDEPSKTYQSDQYVMLQDTVQSLLFQLESSIVHIEVS
jgi:hypothetical protein